MSNGGGENGRVYENHRISKSSSAEEFAQTIAKIAVAQVCESEGFQTFQLSALEKLSDISIRYIHNLGKNACTYANISGRLECNVFDIIHGLEDLGSGQGFSGASDVEHCLADSGAIGEITHYVVKADPIPFTRCLPKFPILKDQKWMPSFSQLGVEPPEHIPAWLPTFPDSISWVQSPTWNDRVTELHMTKITQKQKKEERSSFNIQHWLAGKGIEGSFSAEHLDSTRPKQAESNPFLAAPLPFGEKEVSPVVLSTKLLAKPYKENHVMENNLKDSHISAWEAFEPAVESMKKSHCNSEENMSLSSRSTVRFKIGMGRKYLGPMLDFRTNQSFEDLSHSLCRKGSATDKKRRAEKILKEFMETSLKDL